MRILLVDDEPQIIELIKKALSQKGFYQLDTAMTGRQGLELIQSHEYDLLFFDLNLPDITGLELVRYAKEKHLSSKIVMMTGYEVMESFLADSIGADEYLQKPFRLADLKAILQKYGSPVPGAKGRILMIDDEEEIVELVSVRLENDGFEVLIARDSAKGLEKIRRERPDLIILDLWLKPSSGEEVCKAVREDDDEGIAKIPIIMLSAKKSQADRIVGRVIGANSYLTKPLDSQELLSEVRRLLPLVK